MTRIGTLFSALIFLVFASPAQTAPNTFIHTGSGSGTLNDVSFGALAPLSFTITANGFTEDVEIGLFLSTPHDNASITIAGLGTFDFLVPTMTFVNSISNAVGFSHINADLFVGPNSAAYDTWQMNTSLGPVAGSTARLHQWDAINILTSGGTLFFNPRTNIPATFQAIVGLETPLPAALPLFATGLSALGLLTWRRKRKAA